MSSIKRRIGKLETVRRPRIASPAPELVRELAAALVGDDYRLEVIRRHGFNYQALNPQKD